MFNFSNWDLGHSLYNRLDLSNQFSLQQRCFLVSIYVQVDTNLKSTMLFATVIPFIKTCVVHADTVQCDIIKTLNRNLKTQLNPRNLFL